MSAPVIPGFVVRAVEPDDAQAWARYALLPEVKEFTSSRDTCVDDIAAMIARVKASEPHSPLHFVLIPEGESELVASVGFHTVSALNRTAEITYDVTPALWGRGIGRAACAAAVEWAFTTLGWHRIQATTLLAHQRSQRILERCGFQREGLLRHFRVVRDAPADYWLYSILPGEVRK